MNVLLIYYSVYQMIVDGIVNFLSVTPSSLGASFCKRANHIDCMPVVAKSTYGAVVVTQTTYMT